MSSKQAAQVSHCVSINIEKLYYNYIYCAESHFVTFLVGGVSQDFFQFKKRAMTQKRLKNTVLEYLIMN